MGSCLPLNTSLSKLRQINSSSRATQEEYLTRLQATPLELKQWDLIQYRVHLILLRNPTSYFLQQLTSAANEVKRQAAEEKQRHQSAIKQCQIEKRQFSQKAWRLQAQARLLFQSGSKTRKESWDYQKTDIEIYTKLEQEADLKFQQYKKAINQTYLSFQQSRKKDQEISNHRRSIQNIQLRKFHIDKTQKQSQSKQKVQITEPKPSQSQYNKLASTGTTQKQRKSPQMTMNTSTLRCMEDQQEQLMMLSTPASSIHSKETKSD